MRFLGFMAAITLGFSLPAFANCTDSWSACNDGCVNSSDYFACRDSCDASYDACEGASQRDSKNTDGADAFDGR